MAIAFVTGIMGDDLPADATAEQLLARVEPVLREHGFTIGDGLYRVVPASTYADRPWHVARHECPFVGELRGYLEWEHWWEAERADVVYQLALGVFRAARGATVRLDDGRVKHAVRLREIHLGAAVAKSGFDGGNELLYREHPAYQEHVMTAIRHALGEEGLGAELGFSAGRDNPYSLMRIEYPGEEKLWPLLWRGRYARENLVDEAVLWRCSTPARVWTFDFDALDDVDFWAVERSS